MIIVAYILSAICYLFGILFVWSAFGTPFDGGALVLGLVMIVVGSVILSIATRKNKNEKAARNVTYNIDLGGGVKAQKLSCPHCGGEIGPEAIKVTAGAPMVTCPYCGAAYQLTEEPKW